MLDPPYESGYSHRGWWKRSRRHSILYLKKLSESESAPYGPIPSTGRKSCSWRHCLHLLQVVVSLLKVCILVLFVKTWFKRTARSSEFSPLNSIYVPQSVPPPPLTGSGPAVYEHPYQAYRTVLQSQLRCRTPRLQTFLNILEESAASLQKDYTRISLDQSSKCVHIFVSFEYLWLSYGIQEVSPQSSWGISPGGEGLLFHDRQRSCFDYWWADEPVR